MPFFDMTFVPLKRLERQAKHLKFQQEARRQSLKRKGNGPFQGPTSSKVFQTVDLGADDALRTRFIATMNPQRSYALVDKPHRSDLYRRVLAEIARDTSNITVHKEYRGMESFIDWMKKNGWKTRHINIDQPFPYIDMDPREGIHYVLAHAHEVLLPNGKIFVATESRDNLLLIQKTANEFGLRSRLLPNITLEQKSRITTSMLRKGEGDMKRPGYGRHGRPIYRIEITFGLKKAVPKKDERRNWPRN